MRQHPKQTVTVWSATLNGDCNHIHTTHEALMHSLQKTSAHYTDENASQWVIQSNDEEVPVADGELVFSTNGFPHLFWMCPVCGREHDTDFDLEDKGPFLWFCQTGAVVLVRRS